MPFKIHSNYIPSGDQPMAIKQLTEGVLAGDRYQTLLGVTGSGKTFTIANLIQNVQRPTLVLTHNKTLVAQLYGEFKQFFPENAVGYFVSYYDYYQPEAYLPTSGVYIEKDLSINEELDKLRLQATAQLLSGRRDIIIVASVSCIYGMGNPTEYENGIIRIHRGQILSRQAFLHALVNSLYHRSVTEFDRGAFRVNGDTVDIRLPYVDFGYRITFFGDEIESIESIEIETGKRIEPMENAAIFPANLYMAPKEMLQEIIVEIQDELRAQVEYFKKVGKPQEAARIKERVEYDIEMIRELGYCTGIANYSRFFDRRKPGTRPFCLLDYFPKDQIMQVIDKLLDRNVDRTAKLTLSLIRQMLRFAFERGVINTEPTAAIRKSKIGKAETPRDRVLSESEIQELAKAIPTANLSKPTELAIWLALSTGCRIGELLKAQWLHIDFENSTWIIPEDNSKNGKAHKIHLSNFALTPFKDLKNIKSSEDWCYPNRALESHVCMKTITKQVSDRQLLKTTKPMSNRTHNSRALILSNGKWTPHDHDCFVIEQLFLFLFSKHPHKIHNSNSLHTPIYYLRSIYLCVILAHLFQ